MNYYGEEISNKVRLANMLRIALSDISPVLNSYVNFAFVKKKLPNLKVPTTLDEKLVWLKLYYYANSEEVRCCADKSMVRAYLDNKGYDNLLTNVYCDVERASEIPWDNLPDRFAIKWSFGSGFNIICEDRNTFDFKRAIHKLDEWSKIPYWKLYSEMQYKDTPHRLIVEEYLAQPDGSFPPDYKFYCFNGEAKFVMVCVGRETGKPRFFFFDRNWNLMRLNKWGIEASPEFTLPIPDGMNEMFSIAEDLSAPFPFVRVDLYNSDGKIIFGEFTFSPSAGWDKDRLPETDLFFGSLLDISGLSRNKR